MVATALLKDTGICGQFAAPEHIRNYSKAEMLHLVESAGLNLTGHFEFYRTFSTLERELADIMHRSGLSRIQGLGLPTTVLLSSLVRLDFLSQSGGGFGVVATKELGSGGRGMNSR